LGMFSYKVQLVQPINTINVEKRFELANHMLQMIENKDKVVGGFVASSSKEEVSKNMAKAVNDRLDFLRKYFDVDLDDIKNKLIASVNPVSTKFQELAEKTPDLYGPFWIYTTIIFLVAVAGNLSNYLNAPNTSKYEYNFSFVPMSAFYIYGFGFGLPILLSFMMKIFSTDISSVLIVCYYGYSFTIFAPTVLLSIINVEIAKWIFLGYAIAHSTAFLITNLWKELSKYVEKSRYIILGIIVLVQVILLFALKFYFFGSYIDKK